MSTKKSKSWPELGIITKNEVKDKDGNSVLDANGNKTFRLGFKLSEDITVLYQGEEISINEYRSGILTNPVDEVEGLYRNGHIDDDKIESRRESAKKAHSWLRYKVQLPPPRAK